MKKILFIILLPIVVFAFRLSLNNGVENSKPYSVLSLSDTKEFECVEQILAYNTKRYACMFDDNGIMDIQDIDLDLMDIRYKKEDNKIFVVVLPKANSRLINTQNNLFDTQSVYENKSRVSKRFNIIVDPNLSEFDKKEPNGINFDPVFDSLKYPSIGALDFSKTPIEGMDSNDIDIYISVKKAYEKHAYEKVLDDTKIAVERHPQSIFIGEFLLYRLRAMDKAFDMDRPPENLSYDDVIKEGKAWMRKFTSDDNYPEVLYMVARAYMRQNLLSDAKYMIDILLSEHKGSNYTSLAMLEYADELYKNAKYKDALKLYEDVLYSTKDVDIASRAALALANSNIQKDSIESAKKYVLKILNANEKYFLTDIPKAMSLANTFLNKNMPDIAARIYEIVVASSGKRDEYYEASLKNLGIALAKDKQVNKSYEYLTRYENEFKYGEYLSEVTTAKDSLFFQLGENNSTKLHAHYQELMQKYEKSDIGVKALISEMRLNVSERKFKDTLSYTNIVKDINSTEGIELLNLSALELSKEAIASNNCQDVINLVESYDVNRLEIPQFKLYECFNRTARYKDALNLAKIHIQDENLEDRVEWLVNLSRSFYALKEYEDSIKAANEAISLGSSVEYSDPTPALFYRFYSLLKIDNFSEAARTLNVILQLKGQKFKLIEAYDAISRYAYSKNDFVNASTYSKQALSLQNDIRISAYTPSLNFIYADSALKLGYLSDAIDEIKYILNLRLKPYERSRALSMISDVYIAQKRQDLALPYLKECVGSNLENSYTSICKAQLNLIDKK